MQKTHFQKYTLKKNRTRREEGDQEFVTLAAMLLCGDLDLRADTFQQITAKPEVRIIYIKIMTMLMLDQQMRRSSHWGAILPI